MPALPSWQAIIGFFAEGGIPIKLSSVNMAAFRAPTLKPTALYSTEDLRLLMDMHIPPKEHRPPLDEGIWRVHFGLGFNVAWFDSNFGI